MREEKKRSSNIELLRIVAMLAIIAHHYVVNSTVCRLFDGAVPTFNSCFLQLWGMWGKTAINVFVLISGYFMCTGNLLLRRYLKLFMQVLFYSWVMWIVLCLFGYEKWDFVLTVKRFVCYDVFAYPNGGFVPAFLWMYLLIPFMNRFISCVRSKDLYVFVLLSVMMFTGTSMLSLGNGYHHVFWYVTLYFLGAIIRLYPFRWMCSNKICLPILILAIIGAWMSVMTITFGAYFFNKPSLINFSYYFVSDSHKFFALLVSLFIFLVFKNWRLGYVKWINTISATCFGVLLIHAASDGMRRWLWQDFVNVPNAYNFSATSLAGYSIIVMFGVFIICSCLDFLRIRFCEKYYLDVGERIVFKVYYLFKRIFHAIFFKAKSS